MGRRSQEHKPGDLPLCIPTTLTRIRKANCMYGHTIFKITVSRKERLFILHNFLGEHFANMMKQEDEQLNEVIL